jgi:hypothetical protein
MKRILSLIVTAAVLCLPAAGQENTEKLKKLETLEENAKLVTQPDTLILEDEDAELAYEVAAINDSSVIVLGDKVLVIDDTDDETVIRIGKKSVTITDEEENSGSNYEDSSVNNYFSRHDDAFRGHLGGFELGLNSYGEGYLTTSLESEDGYLDLNSSKSMAFNMISPGVSLGITKRFGLVASLGLNFNNYRFSGNNSVSVDEGGILMPEFPPLSVHYEKSKLATLYAVLPVILEGQIPVSHSSSVNIGVGVIGAVKLGSHTKVVYFEDGKQKVKNRDDFSLNLLRYGVTARLGYEMLQVYGTCYLSPMFETGKGPELYPFEVGIALTFND